MIIPYEALTDEAKVLIFPGSRKFFPAELPELRERATVFCDNLKDVDLLFELKYDRFLVFLVSENTPLSLEHHHQIVEFIQGLENHFDLVLLDKVNVSFKQGQYVQVKEIPDFKALIKNKGVSEKTIVFDHMINTKSEFESYWEMPAGQSWLAHFFKK